MTSPGQRMTSLLSGVSNKRPATALQPEAIPAKKGKQNKASRPSQVVVKPSQVVVQEKENSGKI